MDKRFALFDMDGTLVDSMPAWRSLGADYLKSRGIVPPEKLRQRIAPLTLPETAEYFKTLGVNEGTTEMVNGFNAIMEKKYRGTIEAKAGVREYLQALKSAGVRMCVSTATDVYLAEACLSRLGLREFFEFIISCEDLGVGKTEPDVYNEAAKRLGCETRAAAVFEDAPYAAKTAKAAGYYTVGVYDFSPENKHEKLKAMCDEYIEDYFAAAKAFCAVCRKSAFASPT